ncbi:DNA/RNA nuclease SfsA [Arthrobacter alpinus]|uniref:DNA/RNA nuclease SfsA n=1 Tax=Arthrobacter alpinus TaxID=656366 RepID=UPI003B848785
MNQNAANRFVERALSAHSLPGIVTRTLVEREKKLGDSRLDFLVDGKTFIEVKTPLQSRQINLGEHIRTNKTAPFDSTDRFVRHIGELGASLSIQLPSGSLRCQSIQPHQHFRAVHTLTPQDVIVGDGGQLKPSTHSRLFAAV